MTRTCFAIIIYVAMLPADLKAAIRIENSTEKLINVWLMAPAEVNYRGPFPVYARTEVPIPVSPGKYYVVTKADGGEFQYLGWQNYSNHKVKFSLVDCQPCSPNAEPIKVAHTSIFHSEGLIACPRCGRLHTNWKTGWGNEEEALTEHEVGRFDPEPSFRLGVTIVAADGGVLVTRTFTGTPSKNMRLAGIDDGQIYRIGAGVNVITHVNGEPVDTVDEFNDAVARSPNRVYVRIYNTERRSTRDYYTTLR